jgi:acyl-CoA synthetase (AMP-forming)/AMP-acid ligase II
VHQLVAPPAGIAARPVHELLAERAREDPNGTAYVFVRGETRDERLTYGEVDRRARAIAAELCARGAAGGHVLLAHRSHARYICGLFGALYAGAVPVSAYPLERVRLTGTLRPLAAIAADSGARHGIAAASMAELAASVADRSPEVARVSWLTGSEEELAVGFEPLIDAAPESVAYVQYTSGSTGVSKGVELTHSNIVANLEAHRGECDMSADSRIVTWLPLSHDMGLIGPVFHPLYLGSETVFLTPESFLLKPVRWLRAITRYGGTITGAPNFAYDLCVDRVTFDELDDLDLSSWTHALNGAEPIRPETLRRFIDAFEQVGFRRSSMVPAFGLAECTCMATMSTRPTGPATQWFDRRALQHGEALAVKAGDPDGVELVSCGTPPAAHHLAIAATDGERLGEGIVGEVWLSGPSVARGYHGDAEQTERVFGAELPDEPGRRFLRTGDLGFLLDRELFVTGRAKDVVIVRGQNHLPDHIERSAQDSHDDLEPHAGAAFSVDGDGEERLVIVQELRAAEGARAPTAEAIRAAVSRDHGLRVWSLVLLAPGALPKTPTGKTRRRECRDRLLAGTLDGVLYSDGPLGAVT